MNMISEPSERVTLAVSDATELLYREAHYLDLRRWDDWLGLYTRDAVFWMPSWRDENETTDDPETELSLIYYAGRANLEDRVWRVRSGLSVASVPLPRTAHVISNILAPIALGDGLFEVHSTWMVNQFNPKRKLQQHFFGRYEHHIRLNADGWRIARKKIVLLNDYIPTVIDFYSI